MECCLPAERVVLAAGDQGRRGDREEDQDEHCDDQCDGLEWLRFDGGGMAWAWLTGDSQVRTHISWMGSEPQFRTSQGAPLKRRAEPISG